ncbi:alpha/beta hydrolase fold containing protein [Candidatus Scalindua japonica]|uniref:Alpha/beta hydrolase fold containing protein n=1 Tax=Candidatus Scalindua japonica TaxID=1284222 RepID=A0A286TUZ6_9BACT|nr:alpha/beta fold hydrolase [Candidatus Scalindua japonica]GAX59671.1 alpha/beta hydrolase fold containing protein [Candidatus Scalindua japonica]
MPSVKVNGVKINFIQLECESGKYCEDLVMVHGLATNLAFWYLRHAPAFSKRYKVTLYDLRGHGRSSMTNSGYTAKNMAVDLRQLLEHLGIERAHFVGHSFGGNVALALASLDAARFNSLMLIDTHISAVRRLGNKKKWEFGEKVQQIFNKNNIDINVNEPYFGYKLLNAVATMQIQNIEISPEVEELLRPLMWKKGIRTVTQWLKLINTTEAEKELMSDDGLLLNRLRMLRFPILAMYGEHSQAMLTGEQLLKLWPHADFRRIREAGHFFPITRPSEFMENCREFWKGALVNKLSRRKGDSNQRYFRSNRYYVRDDKWFFDTRESIKKGPFENLNEAKEHLLSQLFC